jgi:predicted RNA methylase
VHYTPREVADELVERAFAAHGQAIASGAPFSVCDPTCGAGVFLLAAADALVAAGRTPFDALAGLRGMDIDPDALEVARAELVGWARTHGVAAEQQELPFVLIVGDALNDAWPEDGRLDVVVGNPPFGGQLAGATVRDESAVAGAARILGRPAGYTDTAGVLLVRALDAVRVGGSVVFVQPLSVLGSRDGAIVRDLVSDALESIWIPDDQLFDAAVSVCAPVLRKPSAAESAADSQLIPTWTELAAEAMGVPSVHLRGEPLSTIADCTAGFRHEFYEVANATIEQGSTTESANFPRLITVGLIDPARLLWGERAARIAGTTFTHPVVDVSKLVKEFALRKRPKILVATQTRIIEAVADYDGSLWPSVPVISALPSQDGEDAMDLLLAAVLAPPASVWAARQAAGTARSPGAVRLSATQLELLPLPTNPEQWRAGAAQLRAGELEAAAVTLTDAYGLDQSEQTAVLNWWTLQSKRRKRQGKTTGL